MKTRDSNASSQKIRAEVFELYSRIAALDVTPQIEPTNASGNETSAAKDSAQSLVPLIYDYFSHNDKIPLETEPFIDTSTGAEGHLGVVENEVSFIDRNPPVAYRYLLVDKLLELTGHSSATVYRNNPIGPNRCVSVTGDNGPQH